MFLTGSPGQMLERWILTTEGDGKQTVSPNPREREVSGHRGGPGVPVLQTVRDLVPGRSHAILSQSSGAAITRYHFTDGKPGD